jgi:hypothetical protein
MISFLPNLSSQLALEPWVNRLAFQGQHSEDALVHPAQRLLMHEALKSLHAERKVVQLQPSVGG